MPHRDPGPRPTRRNRTRQREVLLTLLRTTDLHPTAAELFESAQAEFPTLSLGTVYRNLEVLVSEGLIDAVPCAGSAMRYDGNPKPHHHFLCEDCGAIQDIELVLPEELQRRLRRKYRLRADRARIDFYGLCNTCRDRSDPQPE